MSQMIVLTYTLIMVNICLIIPNNSYPDTIKNYYDDVIK